MLVATRPFELVFALCAKSYALRLVAPLCKMKHFASSGYAAETTPSRLSPCHPSPEGNFSALPRLLNWGFCFYNLFFSICNLSIDCANIPLRGGVDSL
jgi:hypothetical protein